jgi:hypothetical protein
VKRFIVCTTINSPTEALKKFAKKEDWTLIVVGDKDTPHEEYEKLDCIYLSPDDQYEMAPTLSDLIGWNSIQRRNFGFIYAYKDGADVVATVDDDNIPYDSWGKDLLVGQTVEVDCYTTEAEVFDPLSVTNHNYLWHRGYPIEELPNRLKTSYIGKIKRRVLIQADLWDGNPDVDAIARIAFNPNVKFDVTEPFCSDKVSPFNSQNTFIAREALPIYTVWPHVGRMDDIWGGYLFQMYSPYSIVYNRASVFQRRNEHNLVSDLEAEIIGYKNTLNAIENMGMFYNKIPESTQKFILEYARVINS